MRKAIVSVVPILVAFLLAAPGARVRYVSLPHESHGWQGRESMPHTPAKTIERFERCVKGAGED
jgi:hypothetical protein